MRHNRRPRASRRAAAEANASAGTPLSIARDAFQTRLGLLLLANHTPAVRTTAEPRWTQLAARVRVEELERRAALLSAVGDLLEVEPDALAECTPLVLSRLASLLVPALADLVRIDLLRQDGTLEPAAAVHGGAARAGWIADGAPVVVARAARTGAAVVMADVAEESAADTDGLPREVRSVVSVPMRARGRTIGVLTLATVRSHHLFGAEDVRLAEEIARSAAVALDNARRFAEVQAEARCREQALASVSHEMRSPLQVISIASGALLRSWPADAALLPERRQIAVIAQSAERMRRLAADLVDLSRMDSGHFAVSPEPVRVGVLLQSAAEVYRPMTEQNGITLAVSSCPTITAQLDEQRVHQVFANLVSNAVRFTPAGGTITLAAEAGKDEVRFTVADTGAGIAPENLPRVFDRFWSAGKCRDCAGLGLAISRAIVQAHGGTISVQSQPGQGTTFTFSLPLAGA
jgi:signal transduction histidine kinase